MTAPEVALLGRRTDSPGRGKLVRRSQPALAYGHHPGLRPAGDLPGGGGRTDCGSVRTNTPHLRRRGVFVGRCARAVRLLRETSIPTAGIETEIAGRRNRRKSSCSAKRSGLPAMSGGGGNRTRARLQSASAPSPGHGPSSARVLRYSSVAGLKGVPQVVLRDLSAEYDSGDAREVVVDARPQPGLNDLRAEVVRRVEVTHSV